jgi:hypothetical protein
MRRSAVAAAVRRGHRSRRQAMVRLWRWWCTVVSIFGCCAGTGAALAIGGTSDGVGTSTVFLFRHCVRNIDMSVLGPYTAHTFPSWGVGKDQYVPRGLDIMQGVGAQLRKTYSVQAPLVVADDVPRNIDSAHALAKGLGLPSSAVTVNGSAFFRCKPPDKSKETKLIAAALKSAPVPPNASALVALIDRTLGGKKHIAAEKNKVEDGKLKGRISLASMAAETFLMQHGAGVPLAWGKLTPDQMYDLQRMHVYEWAIDRSAEAIEAAKSSHMLATIVEALAANNTTTIFLGHDTDINGVGKLLDVGWSAPPLPDNTTAPNVALRFHAASDGTISLDFVYTTYDTTEGILLSTPILKSSTASFCKRASRFMSTGCATLPVGGVCASPTSSIAGALARSGVQ